MSMHTHDDPALRISITERLALARAQVESLRPHDKELRGRLREQLDDMLAELLGTKASARRVLEAAPRRAAEPAVQPAIVLRPNGES